MNSGNEELFSDFDQGAIAQHEMYRSWVAAGFSEDQAMELVKLMVLELLRRAAFDD